MYGVWWAGVEPDVLPAERAAKGYNALDVLSQLDKHPSELLPTKV
jgi:branched-chain amino acid transport system substrate-binding protein